MILNWTSSVNMNVLPTPVGDLTYADMMKYNIWNLYNCLISSGWTPVSSSYYDYDDGEPGYVAAAVGWSNINHIRFPESMTSSADTWETIEESNGFYHPSEHSWVTVKKLDSKSKYTYLTIDCRYPLPPHIDNVASHYLDLNTKETTPSKISVYAGVNSLHAKVFDKGNEETEEIIYDRQNFDPFHGICVRDTANISTPVMPTENIYGQSYNSKVVAFVDIVVSLSEPKQNLGLPSDDPSYISATTRVRPKYDADDNNSMYTCWGFDCIEAGDNKKINKEVQNEAINFRYHFHHDPGSNAFIYQLSTRDRKQGFDCMFGIVPVQNASNEDIAPWTTLTINIDPGYDSKSYCRNTFGANKVIRIDNPDLKTPQEFNNLIKNSANTFYNTCYRNYNFSDGVSCKRFGDVDRLRKLGNLPVFTPLEPKHATLFPKDSKGLDVLKAGYTPDTIEYLIAEQKIEEKNLEGLVLDPETPDPTELASFYLRTINTDLIASQKWEKEEILERYWENGYLCEHGSINSFLGSGQFFMWDTLTKTFMPAYAVQYSHQVINAAEAYPPPSRGGVTPESSTKGRFVVRTWAKKIPLRVNSSLLFDDTATETATACYIAANTEQLNTLSSQEYGTENLVVASAHTVEKNAYPVFKFATKSLNLKTLPKFIKINGIVCDKDNGYSKNKNVYFFAGKAINITTNTENEWIDSAIIPTKPTAAEEIINYQRKMSPGTPVYSITGGSTSESWSINLTAGEYFRKKYGIAISGDTKENRVQQTLDKAELVFFTVPLMSVAGKYLESRSGATTRVLASGPTYIGLGKASLSIDIRKNPETGVDFPEITSTQKQKNGTGAFSLFKSFVQSGQCPLVAVKYDFATTDDDGNLIAPTVDVFETTVSKDELDIDDSMQAIAVGRYKNSFDNSSSELPIFLLNGDELKPAMKGYVTDILWGPRSVEMGSLVPNQDEKYKVGSTQAAYQKIFWKGWWLPWIANEPAEW